jgi:hypothetical protein
MLASLWIIIFTKLFVRLFWNLLRLSLADKVLSLRKSVRLLDPFLNILYLLPDRVINKHLF